MHLIQFGVKRERGGGQEMEGISGGKEGRRLPVCMGAGFI